MTTAARKTKTTQRGLGYRHRQAVAALKRKHRDGSPCDWCGKPLYLDRTKNWDFKPGSTNPSSGSLHGDHSAMSRADAVSRGLSIPPADRLLHGACNIQRGSGVNEHLATNSTRTASDSRTGVDTEHLAMAWPW